MSLLQLVDLFGTTRDNWMAADLQSWLAPNKIYDGLPPALKHAMENEEVYIVTTKQVISFFGGSSRECTLQNRSAMRTTLGSPFLWKDWIGDLAKEGFQP